MSFKAILFVILLITVCITAQEIPKSNRVADPSRRQSRLRNYFLDLLLQNSTICTGCPNRYCDTDPGIILGYCCGCRRSFDILPVFCSPSIICPPYINDVCHDYEYMLHCCC